MALTCPNRTMPEWKALEAAVGKMEAYRDYMETDGDIRTPDAVKAKLESRSKVSYQLVNVAQEAQAMNITVIENLLKVLAKKFGPDYGWRIDEGDPNGTWRGKLEEPNEANGMKPTVVINPALVRLDTPIHEFGHLFIAMIKQNKRLYANLLKSVRVTQDYADQLVITTTLYEDLFKGEGLTGKELQFALEEETIVELLGKYAANKIDPQTGLFKAIEQIWEAIKKILQDIISADGVVDVLNITPNATLEEVANLLVHPDVKFIIGAEKTEMMKGVLKDLQQVYDRELNMLNILEQEALAGNLDQWTVYDTTYVISKTTRTYFKKLMSNEIDDNGIPSAPPIMKLSFYLKDQFEDHSKQLFREALDTPAGTDPQQFYDNVAKKYKWWFYSLNAGYDKSDQEHKVKAALLSFVGAGFTNANANAVSNHVRSINNTITSTSAYGMLSQGRRNNEERHMANVVARTLDGTVPGLNRLFKESNKAFLSDDFVDLSNLSIEEIVDKVRNKTKDAEKDIQKAAKGNLFEFQRRQRRDVPVESINPRTGAIEQDEITISLEMNKPGEVYVVFSSALFDMNDPYYDFSLSPQEKIIPGITKLAHRDAKQGSKYTQQAVAIKDLGLDIIVASNRSFHGPEAKELDDDEIDAIYKDIYDEYRERSGTFRVTDPLVGPEKIPIEYATATDRQLKLKFGVTKDEYYYKIPKAFLRILEKPGGSRERSVINAIVDSMSHMLIGEHINTFTFSPVAGQSMSREGNMRDGLYKQIGRMMFHDYHIELQPKKDFRGNIEFHEVQDYRNPNAPYTESKIPVYPSIVLVPRSFQKGLIIDKALYQKAEKDQASIPLADKSDSGLIEQALEFSASENHTDPIVSDQTEAVSLAQDMSGMLGIEYQTVTAEEARALTENTQSPWNGQSAFFVGGIVYFVGDHLSMTDVFHEFSHPFVRHLSATNPKLFTNLYNQLKATPEGQALINEVKESHPDLNEGTDMFMEEVIVKALTASGMDKLNKLKTESTFTKVINNILYAIKQGLRAIFGKVPVSKLSASTTMAELADMLVEGGKIEIDKTLVSQADVVAYNAGRSQYIEDVARIDNTDMQTIINKLFDVSSNHINQLLTNRNYDALADLLVDEDKRGDLDEMKSNLQSYQTAVSSLAKSTIDDMNQVKNKSTALINSLFRLKTVMAKIQEHIKDLKEEGETQDNLHKAYYYDHLIKHWQQFINETVDTLNENDLDEDSPLFTLLGSISNSITKTKKVINDMYADGARDALYDQLLPMQQSIKLRYDQDIQTLRDKGASPARIDRMYKEYHGVTQEEHARLKELQAAKALRSLSRDNQNELIALTAKANKGIAITPEKIELILKGGMGDANFFNSYLEGYLYNTDPVIGGLASYVKSNLNQVMVTAQGKYNDFSKDMKPILEDAGFNPLRPGDLGEALGFKDKVAKKQKDGTIIERLVWTFLNAFKNYRYDYDWHKDNVEKAQLEYQQTGTTEAEKKMKDAIVTRQKFMRTYFHQQYVPEFYDRDALFEKDETGKAAMLMRKRWGEDYRALTEPANTPEQQLEITGQVDLMWRKWRQMSSIYTEAGKLKTGEAYDIAIRIKEYNDVSRKFYETKPRKGVFQNALRLYKQSLVDDGNAAGSATYDRKVDLWIKQNTIKVPKETWYARTRELYARKAEIMSKLSDADRKALDEKLIMDQIFDLQGGFKDEYGQTKATELSPKSRARIIELELDLQKIRENAIGRNGLNGAQNALFSQLHQVRIAGELTLENGTTLTWGPELQAKLSALYDIKDTMGLSKFELADLDNINTELAGISKREATSYYVDIINTWLDQLNLTGVDTKQVNKTTADLVLDESTINKLLGQNEQFDTWFKSSHIRKPQWNPALGEKGAMEQVWTRSTVWSQTIPIDPSQYETFDLTDEKGNVIETIQGKPIQKYYSRTVKPEYRKEKIVGVTVDNKYQWLPKGAAEGSQDPNWTPLYINEKYEEMKANDPKKFKALQKMKEWHLKNQEGIGHKGRLYYDYPRYRKENLELIQSANFFQNIVQRIKDWFHGAKDDAESGFNYEDQWNLTRMDMFDNEISSVPIHGLYDIESDDVSTDITLTMMQYMLSGERQKQLVKISPLARAIQSVVNANKLDKEDSKGIKSINKFNFFNNNVITFGKQKDKSVREKAITNFIEREFEGKRMTGAGKDVPWLNNTASLLFKRASFGFFAFNIPSALKNSYGAKFQGMIEASAGRYMTHTSFQKGNAWSYAAMMELSFGGQLYQKGPRSLMQQIVEVFDPSQDRFEDRFGEGLSRTVAKDAAGMTWLYNFRKWVELQATFQIFGGMMYHQKVEQTMPDGTKEEINYMDAWELRDEKIQLKEGVDPAWGITYNAAGELQMGAKFNQFKNTTHQVMNNLQGAYAKFDQPEAQRYLVFRFLSYLRRYFTTMTMNRFGFSGRWGDPQPRVNPGLGDVQMGYYITFLRTMKDMITEMGGNLMTLTPEEKRAAFRVITEVGSLIAINLAMSLLFGWDPDDDERFEKLRARSGAMPFPLGSEDPDRPFNAWGFTENHMLMLLMNIRSENEQFIPLPGYGLDDYSAMLDLKSIAFGPTVQTYKEIFEDALDILQGDESAYYKRDVGPYKFQQAGGAKILAHIARTLGMTGSALDPAKSIKGFQSVQARARR